MKILVIKQTSLGDVLHSTGHVRAIKQHWPGSELYLLTAAGSLDIYRHNPWVDQFIMVDRAAVKRRWKKEPGWAYAHMAEVMAEIRQHRFDIAFDLQGAAKSVIFLYGAHAGRKFVKGRWPGIAGFRRPKMHALDEMDGVLALAGIRDADTRMEFVTGAEDRAAAEKVLSEINPGGLPLVVISPFTRWASKDWPLESFLASGADLADRCCVAVTGAPERKEQIDRKIRHIPPGKLHNLAGALSLGAFAELVRRARWMLSGDSFPMHVAVACGTPVVALFGPTREERVGPRDGKSVVLRAPGCLRCDRPNCRRGCLGRIGVEEVVQRIGG
jgi:ADP-heptose:LPS heptosyltransferase